MKFCNGCRNIKSLAAFARRGITGHQPKCKECNRQYRQENKARISAIKQAWAVRNLERAKEIKRKCYENHKVAYLKRAAAWKRANPGSRVGDNISRRLAHRRGTPIWANQFFIAETYALARERTKLQTCGVSWSVDHEIPLRSAVVCGLHTHNNLRVVPALFNVQKGNRLAVA